MLGQAAVFNWGGIIITKKTISMTSSSTMGYFQIGGGIIGPLLAFAGGLIALTTLLAIPRTIYTP